MTFDEARSQADASPDTPAARRAEPPDAESASSSQRLAAMPRLQLLRTLGTSLRGLTEHEAERRALSLGENRLAVRPAPAGAARLAVAARDPFVLLLAGLAAVAALTGSWVTCAVIAFTAAAGCLLRVTQETRGQRAAAALRNLVGVSISVLRRAEPLAPPLVRDVPIEHLVPGDIVQLHPGDLVPADLYLLRSSGLTVSEGALTGESRLAVKNAPPPTGPDPGDRERSWLCSAGGRVAQGSCTAVVIATGSDTALGQAHDTLAAPAAATAYERGVSDLARLLLIGSAVTAAVVFAILAAAHGVHAQALVFALAVAVGLTPEMLPVVTTGVLHGAARRLARSGTVVRRLGAVHNLGAVDTMCIDKTGTLTLGSPAVAASLDPAGQANYEPLRLARLVSAAILAHTPGLLDAVDGAVLDDEAGPESDAGPEEAAPLEGPRPPDESDVLDVLPFDAARRRAGVLLREPGRLGSAVVVVRGAVPQVIEACDTLLRGGEPVALDDLQRERVLDLAAEHAARHERLLAIATRRLPAHPRSRPLRPADEQRLTLTGFVVLRDRPRADAGPALARLAAAGIATKVITGDVPQVAAAVCAELGLDPGRIVTGTEIDACDERDLQRLAQRTTVFAQATPAHKARIVRALRTGGRVTGFLGDGVNDAPALRCADVALALPGGADVSRECADVVLGPDGLAALPDAIEAGRRAAANTDKYLKITLFSNAGNALSMLLAALLLPFLPMLPVQILVQNLVFDLVQLALAADRGDPAATTRPCRISARELAVFTALFAPINTLADLVTFRVLAPPGAPGAAAQALFHAGLFTENLLTQLGVIYLLRARHAWAKASRPHGLVLASTAALAVTAFFLPRSPLALPLGFVAPQEHFYLQLAAIVVVFYAATAAAKAIYARAGSHDRRGI